MARVIGKAAAIMIWVVLRCLCRAMLLSRMSFRTYWRRRPRRRRTMLRNVALNAGAASMGRMATFIVLRLRNCRDRIERDDE
jgi:hypothetical protein